MNRVLDSEDDDLDNNDCFPKFNIDIVPFCRFNGWPARIFFDRAEFDSTAGHESKTPVRTTQCAAWLPVCWVHAAVVTFTMNVFNSRSGPNLASISSRITRVTYCPRAEVALIGNATRIQTRSLVIECVTVHVLSARHP